MLCVGISNVISLLSGIALFLFGMALMGDGLKQVAGNKLELILYRLTGNPIKGFLLGAGVTAVIQSSSATSVMIVGFVNSGMMKVRQAISIVLGAILGTSITGWIICLSDIGSTGGWLDLFSTATLTGVISVIGIVVFVGLTAWDTQNIKEQYAENIDHESQQKMAVFGALSLYLNFVNIFQLLLNFTGERE